MKDNLSTTPEGGALYFTRDELRSEFSDEIKQGKARVTEIHPHIFFGAAPQQLYWVLDFWPGVKSLTFESISDAARKLRPLARHWTYAGGANFRRGQLIAEALRVKAGKAIVFPEPGKNTAPAAFTLKSEKEILYSLHPHKAKFAGGKISFVEDKKGPPSRAYLKLWEAFSLVDFYPGKEDTVLDLGATPGGWSYVAASLGATVTMIDRSEPDAGLMRKFPRLKFIPGDGLHPTETVLEAATVILSDMACEPAKLLVAVQKWLKLPRLRAMVCTLKFHGLSDKKLIRSFADIPGGKIYHLWHNGHELTWIWQKRDEGVGEGAPA